MWAWVLLALGLATLIGVMSMHHRLAWAPGFCELRG